MKLSELLILKEFKYRKLVTVEPDDTISKAIDKLAEYDRGSLPVCNSKGELLGIITERDIVRKYHASKEPIPKKIKIKEVMSSQIIVGTPDDDVSYAINVMKEQRIRHLPIVDNGKVIGMLSMRDLLGVQLEECDQQIRFLNDYVSGV